MERSESKTSGRFLRAASLAAGLGLLGPLPFIQAAAKTGAAFLKIGTGARPEAMGGAYTALSDDVNALHYNPGGLSLLERREFAFTHTQWLLDSQFDFLGFAQPTRLGMLGLAVTKLGTGNQESRDANRQATGGFSASESAYSLGLGRKLGRGFLGHGSLSVGANAKYLQSRIGSDTAATFAVDIGAVHRLDNMPLSLGFSVLNMGRGLKFIDQRDPLPLTLAFGTAYRLGGALHLALDIRHEPYDKRMEVGVGTEYALLPVFAVRAGYSRAEGSRASLGEGASPLRGFGGGFGLRLGGYRLDYNFTPFGELGDVQRISLGARF